MIGKTKTALEAGSFGNRGLGMPGPMGTRDRKSCPEKYRERSRPQGLCRNGMGTAAGITLNRVTKYALFKKEIQEVRWLM